MKHIKNIAIVIDLKRQNSDAIAHAEDIVKNLDAQLILICVTPKQLTAEQCDAVERSFKEKCQVEFSTVFLTGKPLVEITRYCDQQHIDLLIIEPEHEQNKLNQFFHGSLVLSLMRKASCPILVAKSPNAQAYERVVIAVAQEEEQVDADLNDKLITIGIAYAKQQLAECYIVCSWHLVDEHMYTSSFINESAENIEQLKLESRVAAAKSFEQLQKRHVDILGDCQTKLIEGEPGLAISRFVKEHDINLIVMGTVGRAGIPGFLIGNTAEAIVNQVNCSIMAIKPDGFVSPLLG